MISMFNLKIKSCTFTDNTGFVHKTNSAAFMKSDTTQNNLMTSSLITF